LKDKRDLYPALTTTTTFTFIATQKQATVNQLDLQGKKNDGKKLKL
jgi:hypothetical protein